LPFYPELRGLLAAHAAGEDLTLYDLVGLTAPDHPHTRELLSASWALEISTGSIFDDAFHEALDQATGSSLAVAIKQGPALQAVDVDGPAV
jgi:hypothetical protein